MQMTVTELYNRVKERLEAGECDSSAFDACCLLEDIGGVGRGAVTMRGGEELSTEACERVLTAAERRALGEPLQYLLGTWDFLSLTFEVGEGVLIPRPETELLCELTADRLKTVPQPRVLDLCAGSGCVGLGIASLLPDASVTAVEKSLQAFAYLEHNIACYPQFDVMPLCADVLADGDTVDGRFDAIVSNPPYIPADDLPSLQREVQFEPRMALDGGEDGLLFYRVIAKQWTKHLRSGGLVAVEIGIGQETDVMRLFEEAGLRDIGFLRDYADIPRVVYGIRV